jgi:hypothetical protein
VNRGFSLLRKQRKILIIGSGCVTEPSKTLDFNDDDDFFSTSEE